MFKPDAVANGHAGKILDQITQAVDRVNVYEDAWRNDVAWIVHNLEP